MFTNVPLAKASKMNNVKDHFDEGLHESLDTGKCVIWDEYSKGVK